uniref:Uncharacterized protein n=1 Tax=Rhizophora mucronata TaxID=61149 RepID=A0A2P2Q9C5_RHIMU
MLIPVRLPMTSPLSTTLAIPSPRPTDE